MVQRNMSFSRHIVDSESEEEHQSFIHPPPSIPVGAIPNAWHPNMQSARTSIESRQLPEHLEGTVLQHNGMQYPATDFQGSLITATIYHPYTMVSSSQTGCPVPIPVTYGSSDLSPSFCNYGVTGGSLEDHERHHFMNGIGGPCKRKIAENVPGNNQHPIASASTSSSSSIAPMHTRHPVGVPFVNPSSHPVPWYRENGIPTMRDETRSRSVRTRSASAGASSIPADNYNDSVHRSYLGHSHSFQQPGGFWFEPSSSFMDAAALAWNQVTTMPHVPASSADRLPVQLGNNYGQGSYEMDRTRNSMSFPNSLYINYGHHNPPHPLHPGHEIRSHSIAFHPQLPAASYIFPAPNVSHGHLSVPVDGLDGRQMHPESFTPTGFPMQWPDNRGSTSDRNSRQFNFSHLRVRRVDEVAIIDSPDVYDGNYVDHHSDMRLDIENMSYEELLALGEWIGNVSTGLSEDAIKSKLNTRTFFQSSTSINLEELPCEDVEGASCIICQDTYENLDKIGTLDCGHEYHAECLKKWLRVKNVCPICKAEALP